MTSLQILTLVMTGLAAGFAGGLFGIGGGVIIVPALYAVFLANGAPEEVCIKVAVGTSLATIIITAIRSLQAHQRHGNVDWGLLKSWAPWIATGAMAGAVLARFATATALTLFFGVMLMILASQKLFGSTKVREGAALPPAMVQRGIGGVIGAVSSLLGIGGGVMGVVTLTWFGRSVHRAVGTAAGFGLAIAVPGAIGYAMSGWGRADGITGALGYVSMPGFAAIALGTAIAAPWGATAASRLSAQILNRIFGIYMIVIGALMIREALIP